MIDSGLHSLIRDVLSEEIGKARAQGLLPAPSGAAPRPLVREEMVAVRNDADLARLVARVLDLAKDARSREEIERGRWVFRLSGAGSGSAAPPPVGLSTSPAAPPASTARFEKGIIGERQIEALPAGTTRLLVGKAVRFTPLAKDRLRARGIDIERTG